MNWRKNKMENDGRELLSELLSGSAQPEEPEVQSQAEEQQETTQEQTAQEEQQEVVAPEVTAPSIQTAPAIDPMAIKNALLEALVDVKKASDSQQAPAQEPEMSEEELARTQLMKHLGIDKIMEENSQLKSFVEQMKADMAQKQLDHHVGSFKSEYGEDGEKAVIDYLNTVSPEMAKHLDTPEGWRLIADAKVGKRVAPTQPVQTPRPDPLVSSNSGVATDIRGSFDKLRSGDMSKVDMGNLILNLSKGG